MDSAFVQIVFALAVLIESVPLEIEQVDSVMDPVQIGVDCL